MMNEPETLLPFNIQRWTLDVRSSHPLPHMRIATLLLIVVSTLSLQAEQFKALVFADASDKWHHESVPVARASFERLSNLHFFELTWVETDAAFAKQEYENYDVVVFISANPCALDEVKRTEFTNYVNAGGGIVGVHAACATLKDPNRWLWWEALLGRTFIKHPIRQSATINVTDPDFPACLHLGQKFLWTDEWYEFEPPHPPHLNVVLTVDESTYTPTTEHRMGAHHPVAWWHTQNGRRVFYTSLGHNTASYNDAEFLKHIYGGMLWAVGERSPEW